MKIGILGGGQLARMMVEECSKFGFEFVILSKEIDSPAGQIVKKEIVGDWNDETFLKEFSELCDIITLENEFIDFRKIKFLEELGKKVYPNSEIIKLLQDKYYQKETLKKIGISVANFSNVESETDVLKFAVQNKFPVILKSRTMGYDGKGNFKINSERETTEAFDVLGLRGKLMCESFINFKKEIAIQVVRSANGEIKVYPVVETIQKNHICHLVIASSSLFGDIRSEINDIAKKIVTELNYIGVMGIEMFLNNGEILVNELAPRVHNSGHYSIEGSYTSQFENHIRAIMNAPPGNIEMTNQNAVMINILGERNGEATLEGLCHVLKEDKAYLHIYGKKKTMVGRKMGHITVLGDDLKKTIETATKCREYISI